MSTVELPKYTYIKQVKIEVSKMGTTVLLLDTTGQHTKSPVPGMGYTYIGVVDQ